MSRLYQLKKVHNSWEFSNEAALEDFIWDNLQALFGLIPLRRQHHTNGNYCDLIGIGKQGNLVILELKNSEDRYVVQQLSRYYDALIETKPFHDQVDYSQPISLIVISPCFHNDNLVDKKYHRLSFQFLKFEILEEEGLFFINLLDLDDDTTCQFPIPFQVVESEKRVIQVAPPPRSLSTGLARCNKYDLDLVFATRKKILEFDERMKEIQLKPGDFVYGKGKTLPCSQFSVKKETTSGVSDYYLHVGLWLPVSLYSFDVRSRISRVILSDTFFRRDWDSKNPLNHGLYQRGWGRTQQTTQFWQVSEYLWQFLNRELQESVDLRHLEPSIYKYCEITGYPVLTDGKSQCLDFFVHLALDIWRDRIEKKSRKS